MNLLTNSLDSLGKWIKLKFVNENEKLDENVLNYKILVLGEPGVGKSSICMRFCKNEFNLEIKQTESCECYTKNLKLFENKIKLFIVDIDQNIMNSDRSHIYSEVKGALIIYDVTKPKTFEKIDNWLLDVKQNTKEDLPIFIVGNKTDLTYLRNVDSEEGLEKANLHNVEFFETSCVENVSVKELLKLLVSLINYKESTETKKNYFKTHFCSEAQEEQDKLISVSENNNYNDNIKQNSNDDFKNDKNNFRADNYQG
jgi:small GTP-binding protein